jgi:GWxTD domain-containing protein
MEGGFMTAMVKTMVTLWATACVSVLPSAAQAQVEAAPNPATQVPSAFDVDAICFASGIPGQSRLDVFAAIGYEQLSFVKREDKFVASYEMTIAVFDSSNALVGERLWNEEVKTPSFDQSVSSGSSSLILRSFEVPPGRYRISVICRDNESRVTRRVAKQLTATDFSVPGLHLSDIMLIARLSQTGGKRNILPVVSSNVGSLQGAMHIFFEAYNDGKPDTIRFVARVLTQNNTEVLKMDSTVALDTGTNQVFLRIDQSALAIGDYKLYVQAFPATTNEPALATTSRSFIVRWAALPRSVASLDAAIDQIVYIAREKELSYIKEATTPEEKQKRFFDFWKKRDPNPNTIRNERMEEHYARVDYANKHFKHYSEGWRTDMGMVYIMFGTPSNVDRHPFEGASKPYEIWTYYDLNHSFVFIDQTGFGDYRLTSPVWEVWQRANN